MVTLVSGRDAIERSFGTKFRRGEILLGGWLFGQLGLGAGGGMVGSIIVAFIGAMILVGITRLIKRA